MWEGIRGCSDGKKASLRLETRLGLFQAFFFVSASVGVGVFAGYCACVRSEGGGPSAGPPRQKGHGHRLPHRREAFRITRIWSFGNVLGVLFLDILSLLVCMERQSRPSGLGGLGHPASVFLVCGQEAPDSHLMGKLLGFNEMTCAAIVGFSFL